MNHEGITQKDRELVRYWIIKSMIKIRDEILGWDDTEIKQYYLDFLENHIEHTKDMFSLSIKDHKKLEKLLTLNLKK